MPIPVFREERASRRGNRAGRALICHIPQAGPKPDRSDRCPPPAPPSRGTSYVPCHGQTDRATSLTKSGRCQAWHSQSEPTPTGQAALSVGFPAGIAEGEIGWQHWSMVTAGRGAGRRHGGGMAPLSGRGLRFHSIYRAYYCLFSRVLAQRPARPRGRSRRHRQLLARHAAASDTFSHKRAVNRLVATLYKHHEIPKKIP